ncbi:MAG TPA: type IV pilin protein [Deltaproteobacteria bacterium]|nr:type IV pilin protein [Deltaproteobacteria bacterium]HOM29730.1 type IV pilin protein [Deltaproteobacteria bacterium]HPP80968.1 type IV pilin protein [Deltaproteobacteria bacterium]
MCANKRGVTLMEVIITVVIVGIIAAIAIPAYTGYVNRTRRAEAVTALETVALYEEKAFAEANTYESLPDLIANRRLPDPNANSRYYQIDVDPINGDYAEGFIATATPINEQAGDGIVFGIDSNGNRGTVSGGVVVQNQDLWNSLRR